ncbi:FMN-dependent NADH-azoreductase [Alteromonas pelagimontana]|uniref:FMN dependent NADH:quinone oxidoreductase n=1 Tax=Alteromonas pelagimontana TaxID=1858656 RepID=A0A6M4M8B5_9ALTE|nr:NAD(P)H-dependent oxidoreductase [Alteromonas pelagimontana]QJR79403.1 FMN-dependent NADH-azoreductase [Alteromonas pelagimontana]
MSNVLAIYASLSQQGGNSTKLVRSYLDTFSNKSDVTVVERDLVADNLDHLSAAEMGAWMTSADERTQEQQALVRVSDDLIAELKNADEIVLGVPMYNFGIPSVLKAWIDRIARAGVTFRYTASGPEGLITGKRVTIFAARGGQYLGTELDTQSKYLVHFFNFIGITDVRFVYAEGLNMGADSATEAFAKANEKIIELTEQNVD